eukprot:gene11490-11633_t
MAAGIEANSKHIARFEAKPFPKAVPANAVTQAFEAGAYAKTVKELQSENAVIRAKAVVAARELLVAPTKHMQCIAAGITKALIQLLNDADEALQAEVAGTLKLLMCKEVGCRDALQHGALPALLQLLAPQKHGPVLRDAVYEALCTASLLEVRHNQDALLQLTSVIRAVPVLAGLIISSHSDATVRLKGTQLLADIASTQADGRKQILASYFLLLPLREDAGISLGTSVLPRLTACSLAVTLVVTPATTAFISRQHPAERERALRQFFTAMAGVLLVFYGMYNFASLTSMLDSLAARQQLGPGLQAKGSMQEPAASAAWHDVRAESSQLEQQQPQQQGPKLQRLNPTRHLLAAPTARSSLDSAVLNGAAVATNENSHDHRPSPGPQGISQRDGDPSLSQPQRLLRAAFYVWVNCMNLVAISSLWARCADAFCPEAAARLFAFIAAGATLGQLAGSVVAMAVAEAAGLVAASQPVERSGSSGGGDVLGTQKPAAGLILISAVLQLLAAQLVCRVRPMQGALLSQSHGSIAAGLSASVPAAAAVDSQQGTAAAASRRLRSRSVAQDAHLASDSPAAAVTGVAEAGVLPSCSGAVLTSAGSLALSQVTSSSGGCSSAAGMAAATDRKQAFHHAPLRRQHSEHWKKMVSGFRMIACSNYLQLLCLYLMLTYVSGSMINFQRVLVVSRSVRGSTQRTAFFALLNTYSACAVLLLQLTASSGVLRLLGVPAALALGPAICLAGMLAVCILPSPSVVRGFEVVRKVFAYAVNRPAREVLFTVVPRDEKYSAKLVIDTVVQRLGDAIAAAAFQVLDVQLKLDQAGIAAAGCLQAGVVPHKHGPKSQLKRRFQFEMV